ncbi:unnamed protein product [Dicrocoelium dendriticum]|nr:unnamed protein product [Dicrocoelium dendriticum]
MWTPTGALKIVDRCKNMFKLTQGEYIAAEKVQGIYQCCPLVQNSFLDGDSSRAFAVVVVHPNFAVLRSELVKAGGKISLSFPNSKTEVLSSLNEVELCSNLDVRKYILSRMNALGRQRGLNGFELAKSIFLTPNEFTIENGLLTPTLKLATHRAREHFRGAIAELYTEGQLLD